MSDIVKRLRDLARVDNCQASLEAARTIEILRVELAKVNMENDRLTRTNRAKREHRDKLLEATSKQADEIERLRAVLDLYRQAVRIDATMEGPRFMGSNASALKRAWDADLAALGGGDE